MTLLPGARSVTFRLNWIACQLYRITKSYFYFAVCICKNVKTDSFFIGKEVSGVKALDLLKIDH